MGEMENPMEEMEQELAMYTTKFRRVLQSAKSHFTKIPPFTQFIQTSPRTHTPHTQQINKVHHLQQRETTKLNTHHFYLLKQMNIAGVYIYM